MSSCDRLTLQNNFYCSDTIIGSIEVWEPHPDTWVQLSSSRQWCCPACRAEKGRNWKGKAREVNGCYNFLSFWVYISTVAYFILKFSDVTHSLGENQRVACIWGICQLCDRQLGFDHEEFAVLKCLEICATKPPLTMGRVMHWGTVEWALSPGFSSTYYLVLWAVFLE